MPDARTMHSPYPSGQGAASVPVLFTLPNVQPAIAAANVTPDGIARNTSPTAESQASGSHPSSALTTHAGAAFDSVSQEKINTYSKKSPGSGSKLGHVTNAVIGVLLLAVVSLTIRNFAPTKPGAANNQSPGDSTAKLTSSPTASHGTPTASASSSGTHPGTTAAVLVASKIDNIRQSDTANHGGGRTDALAAAVTSVPEENQESSASQGSPEESLKEHEESHEEILAGSTTSVPSVPLLLPSKEPKTALGGGATLQYPQPASDASAVAPGPYGTTAVNSTAVNSTAVNSTAVNSTTVNSTTVNSTTVDASADAMPSQVKGNVSLVSSPNRYSGNSSVGMIPNAVDTGTPSLNTRDMINLRNGQRSAKGIVGGTTTVRNPMARGQEAMNPTQSMLMSGETYPPIRKQYEPINIPSAGTQGSSTYQPIYQPALQPNATTQPYTPLTPTFPTPDGTALAPTTPNR